jgi:hypothetical protein
MASLALLIFGLCTVCQKEINIKNCGNYYSSAVTDLFRRVRQRRGYRKRYAVCISRYTPKTLYDLYVTVREISSRLIESKSGHIVGNSFLKSYLKFAMITVISVFSMVSI